MRTLLLSLVHPANVASATAKIRPDGTFELRVRFDVLAFALDETPARVGNGAMQSLLDAPPDAFAQALRDAEARLRTGTELLTDPAKGAPLASASFPSVAEVGRARDLSPALRFPAMGTAVLTGKLPPEARTVAFRFPASLDTVVLTTELPYREPASEPVAPGESSTPLPVPTAEANAAAARSMGLSPRPDAKPPAGSEPGPRPRPALQPARPLPARPLPAKVPSGQPSRPARPPAPTPPPTIVRPKASPETGPAPAQTSTPASPGDRSPEAPARGAEASRYDGVLRTAPEPPSPLAAFVYTPRYTALGYRHILPEGVDHILFILGLFLLGARMKSLLSQVTAFTVAHSLTLGLALFGVVRLPAAVVEPVIALSIAFVAIENLLTKEVKPWRILVVFGFGLIHGLGFASALRELGLARNELLPALLGFNVGVELGQLSVVALALLAVGRFRGRPNYRRFVVVPGSLAIAAVALVWTVQRLLALA